MGYFGAILFLSRVLRVFVITIFTGALAVTAQAGVIPAFTARGSLLCEVFQTADPSPTSRIEETFVFCYSNDWWRMELKCTGGFNPGIPARSLQGNLVDCERVSDGIRIVTSHDPPFNPDAWLRADVEPTEFPPPSRNDLVVCWLALCPNPKLPLLSATMMKRLVSVEFLENPDNKGEYGLKYDPAHNFVSELLITNNGTIEVGSSATRKLVPPFETGHLEFEYKVLETRNWGGYEFPSKSVLRKYVARPGGKTKDDVHAAVVVSVQIDSLQFGEIARPEVDFTKVIQFESASQRVSAR